MDMGERIGTVPSLEEITEDHGSFSYIKRLVPETEETIKELIEGNQEDPTDRHFELWLRYFATFSRVMGKYRAELDKIDGIGITIHEKAVRSWARDIVAPDMERTSADFSEVDQFSLEALRDGVDDVNFLLNVPQNT